VRAILNFLWFVLGGVFLGLAWWLAGIIAHFTIIGIPWGRVLRHRQLLVLPLRQGSDQQARHASTEGGQEGLPCVTITLLFPQSGDGLRVARRQGLQKLGVVTKLRQRSQAAKRHRAPAIARRRFLGANVRLQE
jgi:hypothetical protein